MVDIQRTDFGDGFIPDGCRIWDKETGESLDKDRFRKDLGDVVESYQIVPTNLAFLYNLLKKPH